MPFDTVAQFEKSFPAIQNLMPHQKRIALEVFNSAMKRGDDESTAIAKAIATAKRSKESEDDMMKKKDHMMSKKQYSEFFVMSLAESNLFSDVSDQEMESREYEILKVGEYYDPRYGKFTIDREKLAVLKRNFDENVLQIDVALDANHEPEKGALAWIKGLRVEGDRLLMALKDITQDGKRVLRDKVFKYFSVEFAPFTKVENGKKVTISDVLRGVALTNRPVIKGMAPTFFSEGANNSFITNTDMSVFKKFAEALSKREKVSGDDLKLAKAMFDELGAEEQEEAKESLDQVEAKAEETAEAEAKAAEEEKKQAEEEAEKAKADEAPTEAIQAAEARASDAEKRLAEAQTRLSELEEERKARTLSERVGNLMLSEKNTKGFSKANEEGLKGFVATLSDEQYAQFSDLMGKFVSVNVTELGSALDGKTLDEGKVKIGGTEYGLKDVQVDAEIRALAEREKLSYFDAARKYAETKK